MRRLLAVLLICALLAGCAPYNSNTSPEKITFAEEEMPSFSDLGDPALLTYLEDTVYNEVLTQLDNGKYFVENVSAVYISKEYLEELEYNSKENIYFGYTLSELNEQFVDTRYVFSLGEDGKTTVKAFEAYDDSYEKILKNVMVGSGVILLCVTVSVVSGGVGAPAMSAIFAASAKTGAIMGLSSGFFGGLTTGVVTGIETGDFDEAMKVAALAGSEAFKWGAIAGAISGGAGEAIALKGATLNGLTMNEAAIIQKESGFPLDVIKQFQSMEQYNVCKNAGLTPHMVNGKTALIRNIDLKFCDEKGLTNLQRMQQGLAPLDSNGVAYELHHIGQKTDSTLAILTRTEHRQGGNHAIWHYVDEATDNPSSQAAWGKIKTEFWTKMANILGGKK